VALTALGSLGLLGWAQGCSSDVPTTQTPDAGPPDSYFDPGDSSAGGDGYGTAQPTDSGPPDTTPADTRPQCTDDLKRCAHTFTLPFTAGQTSVELRGDYRAGAWTKGDTLTHVGANWQVTVPTPYSQPVQYKFCVNGCATGADWWTDPGNPQTIPDGLGGTGVNSLLSPSMCLDWTCADPVFPADAYDWRDAVVYFVFVDRFFNGDTSNDGPAITNVQQPAAYHGGDWKGVTQKIQSGYFTDLGVNTLWITVPMQNADQFAGLGTGGDTHYYSGYHGYWPMTPDQPEPRFGTMADLKALVTAAHTAKLKVLFDYAMVHVEKDSALFTTHPDWFWPNSKNGSPDCICGGASCDWNNDAQRCWFASYLPHWNYTVSAARDYSVSNVMWWIQQTGVDGLRLDAIKHVDGSWLAQLRSQVQSTIVPATKQRFYMVGETYDFGDGTNPSSFIKSFIDPSTKLDGQFDFPERLQLVRSLLMRKEPMTALRTFMDQNDGYYGSSAVMSPFVGNHDMGRIINLAADTAPWDEYDTGAKNNAWSGQPTLPVSTNNYQRVANAFAVLFTNRGAPLIYYGDEIGLPGAGDPDNRRDMMFTGLSTNQQWLHDRVAKLLAIRAAHPALRRGTRTTVGTPTSELWVYSMSDGTETVYVAVNRSDADQPASGLPASGTELITGAASGATANIPARETRIFIAK
jgi:glycosidase